MTRGRRPKPARVVAEREAMVYELHLRELELEATAARLQRASRIMRNQQDRIKRVVRNSKVLFAQELLNKLLLDACRSADVRAVRFLVRRGANVDADVLGTTPLVEACGKGDVEVIKELICLGADVNKSSETDDIPLVVSVWQPKAVRALLRAHANPNVVTKAGQSVLEVAVLWGSALSVRELMEHGASAGSASNGLPMTEFAAQNASDEIANLVGFLSNAGVAA
jgi:ankyrin repeat protein